MVELESLIYFLQIFDLSVSSSMFMRVMDEWIRTPNSSSGVSAQQCGFESLPVMTLVSLSKILDHNCCILQMGRKAVGSVCFVMP